MPSQAQAAFESALVDVDNLMWFHENEGGDAPGRRGTHFGSLNKSAIVLLCAAWETYVESVIVECAGWNISRAATPADMLKSIRHLVSAQVRQGKDESTWQRVAGEGWKDLSRSVVQSRVAVLNTPKHGPVSELILNVLGVRELGNNWHWHRNPIGGPAGRLDDFVRLRGSIAHGERLPRSVTKANVTAARDLLTRLVGAVETRLRQERLLPRR